MLRFGPDDGPVVIAALPFWEEANRTRQLVATMLRRLAARGIGGVLPELPGTGDSLVATEAATLTGLREAYAACTAALAPRRCYALGVRGGTLMDSLARLSGRWHLAPMTGDAVIDAAVRLAVASGRRLDRSALIGAEAPVEIAGNRIAPAFFAGLAGAEPLDQPGIPRRLVRLGAAADRTIAAFAPWRRAEPGNDPDLAVTLADDLADWIAQCEA